MKLPTLSYLCHNFLFVGQRHHMSFIGYTVAGKKDKKSSSYDLSTHSLKQGVILFIFENLMRYAMFISKVFFYFNN